MAELSAEEQAKIHETATKVKRCEEDIQQLYRFYDQLSRDVISTKNQSSQNTNAISILTADKQDLFKWALATIAGLVIIGSLIALGMK